MSATLGILKNIRANTGTAKTVGVDDLTIERFAGQDKSLVEAVQSAEVAWTKLNATYPTLLSMDEVALIETLQQHYVNFYAEDHVNPYVALAASGPWLVTTHGAVLHDSGGYGMLGFGHAPKDVLNTMAQPWVMANVMTASFAQHRLATALKAEVGHTRGDCPYHQFLCINSGSEAVTVAARIADINAGIQVSAGGAHEGKTISFIGLKGAFHGRTDRPAQVSDSTLPTYRKHLASFQKRGNLTTVGLNDLEALQAAFDKADSDGVFFEAMFMEPVMGEGNPGAAVNRDFYDLARKLTKERGTMLLVDSIQAGIRTRGCLSIVDYPGFSDCDAPDLETWSKALNGGQYPLSVLAMNKQAAALYVTGVYGNTMTTNPRALEVACTVLDSLTPALRANIATKGAEMVQKLRALAEEFPGAIASVQGTGLLIAAELHAEKLPVTGFGNMEEFCRIHGIGVIHGGRNALRYTPHFAITSAEIDLIIDVLREGLRQKWIPA